MNSDTYIHVNNLKIISNLKKKQLEVDYQYHLLTNLFLFTEINALRYNIKRKNPRRKKEGNCLFFLD